jgi:hypothetical protein
MANLTQLRNTWIEEERCNERVRRRRDRERKREKKGDENYRRLRGGERAIETEYACNNH